MYARDVLFCSGSSLVAPSDVPGWCVDLFTTVHLGAAVLTLPATTCSQAKPLLLTADPRLIGVDIESYFGHREQTTCRTPHVWSTSTYLESLPTYRPQPWTSRSYCPDAPWMHWIGCLRLCKTKHAARVALQRTGLTSYDLTEIMRCAAGRQLVHCGTSTPLGIDGI